MFNNNSHSMQNNNQNFTQNMKNMMDMYNNLRSNQVFNPKKMDNTTKRSLIMQNIGQSRAGWYKNFPKCESVSIPYSACDPGKTDNICQVKVVHEHALDVAEQFCEIGTQSFTKNNNLNPVILNIVGKDFTGDNFESCEDIRDEMMNIRTLFCANPIKPGTYPIKDQNCVHTPYVNVIRTKNPSVGLPWEKCYRVGFITTTPIQQGTAVRKMSSSDFVKTCSIIENVFQIAIGLGHSVLILTPFGHEEDNNPVDDIIMIYNFCIMKYGHKLKSIMIAIPPYYPRDLYLLYLQQIVKPNEIVQEIDNKHEGLMVQKTIQENITKNCSYSDEQTQTESSNSKDDDILDEKDEETKKQFKKFEDMMKNNPKMAKKIMKEK